MDRGGPRRQPSSSKPVTKLAPLWPEMQGRVAIEFRTEATLLPPVPPVPPAQRYPPSSGTSSSGPSAAESDEIGHLISPPARTAAADAGHNDADAAAVPVAGVAGQRSRARRDFAHEVFLRKVKHEVEMQREVLDRLLNPADLENRMREYREKERILRAQREARIKERYEKSKHQQDERRRQFDEAHPPPKPPTKVHALGYLPPMTTTEHSASREKKPRHSSPNPTRNTTSGDERVQGATRRLVAAILAAGVDKKGFLRREASIVQLFARSLISRRLVESRRLARSCGVQGHADSPVVVLSLVSLKRPSPSPAPSTAHNTSTSQREELMDYVRDLVTECIDSAKIHLTKEYVLGRSR